MPTDSRIECNIKLHNIIFTLRTATQATLSSNIFLLLKHLSKTTVKLYYLFTSLLAALLILFSKRKEMVRSPWISWLQTNHETPIVQSVFFLKLPQCLLCWSQQLAAQPQSITLYIQIGVRIWLNMNTLFCIDMWGFHHIIRPLFAYFHMKLLFLFLYLVFSQ